MRYVWFKKEMRQAILEGKKTATTRDHPLPLGRVLAVSGSRFKAQPFAVLEIQDRLPTTKENVARMFFKEEGFESTQALEEYARKNKLLQTDGQVYFHLFKLVEILEKEEHEGEKKP